MENALDLCQSGASGYYDAIAVDINLARNAGEPALVRIRDLVGEECPILGIVEPDHEETDDDYVFDGFLHRPYSPEEFREYFPDFTI
jgi:DNA-binding response OmpR family regulator